MPRHAAMLTVYLNLRMQVGVRIFPSSFCTVMVQHTIPKKDVGLPRYECWFNNQSA